MTEPAARVLRQPRAEGRGAHARADRVARAADGDQRDPSRHLELADRRPAGASTRSWRARRAVRGARRAPLPLRRRDASTVASHGGAERPRPWSRSACTQPAAGPRRSRGAAHPRRGSGPHPRHRGRPRVPRVAADDRRRLGSVRSDVVDVPMLREGEPIGALTVGWTESAAFTDKQIELLQDLRRPGRDRDRERAPVQGAGGAQQRPHRVARAADGDGARSCGSSSSSPTDVQPVFEAIAENALRLCDATFSTVFRFDGELDPPGRAPQHVDPEAAAAIRAAFPMPAPGGGAPARAILTRQHRPHPGRATRTPSTGCRASRRARGLSEHPLPCRCCARGSRSARSRSAGPTARPFHRQADRAPQDLRRPGRHRHRERAACSPRSRTRRSSSRSPTGTSPSSSPTCPTSCARRSTPSSASPRCCIERMFGELNAKQEEYLNDILSSGQAPALAHQRHPRPVEDRGGPDGAGGPGLRPAGRARQRADAHQGARRAPQHRARGARRPARSARSWPTSARSSRCC